MDTRSRKTLTAVAGASLVVAAAISPLGAAATSAVERPVAEQSERVDRGARQARAVSERAAQVARNLDRRAIKLERKARKAGNPAVAQAFASAATEARLLAVRARTVGTRVGKVATPQVRRIALLEVTSLRQQFAAAVQEAEGVQRFETAQDGRPASPGDERAVSGASARSASRQAEKLSERLVARADKLEEQASRRTGAFADATAATAVALRLWAQALSSGLTAFEQDPTVGALSELRELLTAIRLQIDTANEVLDELEEEIEEAEDAAEREEDEERPASQWQVWRLNRSVDRLLVDMARTSSRAQQQVEAATGDYRDALLSLIAVAAERTGQVEDIRSALSADPTRAEVEAVMDLLEQIAEEFHAAEDAVEALEEAQREEPQDDDQGAEDDEDDQDDDDQHEDEHEDDDEDEDEDEDL